MQIGKIRSYSQHLPQLPEMKLRVMLTFLILTGGKLMTISALVILRFVFPGISFVASKPTLGLYYESLDPYSRQFIREEVWPVYQQLGDNFDVKFVAYGNAVVCTRIKYFKADIINRRQVDPWSQASASPVSMGRESVPVTLSRLVR